MPGLVGVLGKAGQAMVRGLPRSQRRVILREHVPRVGVRGEEVQTNTTIAYQLVAKGQAVVPNWQTVHQITDSEGQTLDRTPEFLAAVERQRAFFDPFWAITATMLNFTRKRFGPTRRLAVPIDRLEIANRLLQVVKVKVNPEDIVFASGKQQSINYTGYHLVYVRLAGGEGLQGPCYSDQYARLRCKVIHQNTRAMW